MVLLKNWCAVNANGYVNLRGKDTGSIFLNGNVFGHPRFIDNTAVRTSPITNVVFNEWGMIAQTKNTKYYLFTCDMQDEYWQNIYDWQRFEM